jgi:hypothetical protein
MLRVRDLRVRGRAGQQAAEPRACDGRVFHLPLSYAAQGLDRHDAKPAGSLAVRLAYTAAENLQSRVASAMPGQLAITGTQSVYYHPIICVGFIESARCSNSLGLT